MVLRCGLIVLPGAGRVEAAANAGELASAKIAADGMEGLLAETLQAMRSVRWRDEHVSDAPHAADRLGLARVAF